MTNSFLSINIKKQTQEKNAIKVSIQRKPFVNNTNTL